MPDLPKRKDKVITKLVNREHDLAMLLNLLPPQRSNSAFIVLNSPSGFGKTRLTTRVVELLREEEILAVLVEPQVRAKNIASSVYQGFYIQRCAEALDELANSTQNKTLMPDFSDFLKTERSQRTRALNWKGAFRKSPDWKKVAWDLGFELVDRFFCSGDHSPKKLLTSDSPEAVAICSRYIQHVGTTSSIVFIFREAQHLDKISLDFLTDLAGPTTHHYVILEYTRDEFHAFNQLFADLFDAAELQNPQWLFNVELCRLNKEHLEQLLSLTIPGASEISGEYYLKWDGNLRVIRQQLFTISYTHPQQLQTQLEHQTFGVVKQYQEQLQKLMSTDRIVLCLIFSHGEAISAPLIVLLLEKLNALATKALIEKSIDSLIAADFITAHGENIICLENEDVAEAIRIHIPLQGNLLLAKRVLRDHYRAIVIDSFANPGDISFAVRQTLRLSVELGDISTIEEVIAHLSNGIGLTLDQSWYVSQIVTAVSQNTEQFADQRDRLIEWAAEMAYEISDFQKSRDLLRQLTTSSSVFSRALLCASCTETGDHDDALALAAKLVLDDDHNVRLAGQLVELVLLRCRGRIDEAKYMWSMLRGQVDINKLYLYGYFLRFKELIADFPECLDDLKKSIEWFMERDMYGSAAYSELTLASHLSRLGLVAEAVASINKAKELLATSAKDRHVIFNNDVAVNLLSSEPDAAVCCQKLIQAIPSSGDDYSDIVLYTNLAVASVLAGKLELATESMNRALTIARNPRFADRDVFWGVSFNLSFVDESLGSLKKCEIDLMRETLKPHSLQNDYWRYRFGMSDSVPDRFQYMLSKPYHPMFLSHWTIDMDGLRLLKQAPLPIPLHKSTPIA